MDKTHAIIKFLRQQGLRPTEMGNVITVRFEMKNLVILATEDEEDPYFIVLMPQFCKIEDTDVATALMACNKCNRELRQVKVYLSPDLTNIDAAFQFYAHTDEEIEHQLAHALYMISHTRHSFYETLQELTNDSDTPDDGDVPDSDDAPDGDNDSSDITEIQDTEGTEE